MAEELKLQRWWQTVPGFLTATAAIITAVTGLILALQQTKVLDRFSDPQSQTHNDAGRSAAAMPDVATPNTAPAATTRSTPQPIQMPDGNSVTLNYVGRYRFRYTVLSAQREPLSPDRYLLRFRIRVWTDFPGGVLFFGDSFRLYSGDLRVSPTNSPNQLVARDETKEGEIEFEIDGSIREAALAITYASDTRQLRLVIP